MTKIVPIVLTEYQSEIYNTQNRIVVPTGAAGVGTTWGLLFKAFKEANEGKLVTFIGGSEITLNKQGGLFSEATKVAGIFNAKVSQTSRIISVGDGKVKFIGNDVELDRVRGLSTELVIFDHIKSQELLQYFLMKSSQVIIGMHFYNIMESDKWHWLQKMGIVECDESGTPIKFADFVHHISCKQSDGFKWKGRDEYLEWFETNQTYDMQKLTVSDFLDWKF